MENMSTTTSQYLKQFLGRQTFVKVKKVMDVLLTYKKSTYSQFGEDRFLQEHFKSKQNGFFVDVGAYHPRQFSNTYLLYKKGWRGVNVDATPGSMALFNLLRPGDANREYAVSDTDTPVRFTTWGTDSENTVHAGQADAVQAVKGDPISVVELQPKTLTAILQSESFIPKNFDLLSVDVEGWDLNVLQSLDWGIYSPQVIMVEQYAHSLEELTATPLYNYLISKGYTLTAWYNPTLIFRKK